MQPIGLPPRRARLSAPFALTGRSGLRGMVVRMISLNSLAAFTAEVSRLQGTTPARGATSAPTATAPAAPEAPRRLDAVPPPPGAPLPRGSLLDLRV